MTAFLAELIGTGALVLLGNGVVANVVLTDTKGHNGGWIVITTGWALAVYVGVVIATPFSGAHLNPAVTIAMATAGKLPWSSVLPYIIAQMIGAMIGAFLVWVMYRDHFNRTADSWLQLAAFSTKPSIPDNIPNLISELIGLSLGGTTGYAINPARDLGPRIMHFLLPMKNKRDSNWGYAWIPVLGPILGGVLAALVYTGFK